MSLQAWISIAIVLITLAVLVSDKLSAEIVMLGALVAIMATGVLTPAQALGGFSNEGMITVAAMYVIAAGLRETGAIDLATHGILGRPKSAAAAQFRLMSPVLVSSAFINNTPVVSTFLPAVLAWSKRIGIAPSKLLIPLSYAAILGGCCTLIGTSTNLIVNGLWKASGRPSLNMFDIAWVGVPCALAGMAFFMMLGARMLPQRAGSEHVFDNPREYTVEMMIDAEGPMVGKTVQEAGLRQLGSLFLVEIVRGGRIVPAVVADERLLPDDRLVFAGDVAAIVELQRLRGLKPVLDEERSLARSAPERKLVEVVIAPRCPLIHQTLRDSRFHTYYGASVIAVAREGKRITGSLGNIELKPADTLLLEARSFWVERNRLSPDFLLVSEVEDSQPPRFEKALIAWAILLVVIGVATAAWTEMVVAAFLGGLAMFATGCVSLSTARRSVDYQVLIVIACSFALGKALESSGAAHEIAQGLLLRAGTNPWMVLALVYGITLVLTELVSNNAAAVLMFPITMSVATALGVSPLPFVMVLMVAASCGFATPLGYQTHLMVMGPGGYRFLDFVKVGIPMDILVGLVAVAVAPIAFPFKP